MTQLLTIIEAADRLKISRSSMYLKVLSGEIPSLKIGRSRRLTDTAIAMFIERMERETSGATSPATPTNA